jgi:hypothetical protein
LKTPTFIPYLFLLIACNGKHSDHLFSERKLQPDTIIIHDTIYVNNQNDWQQGFGLTHESEIDSVWGKPVKFYIKNPKCSPTAIDFYLGEFRPTDNNTTSALLKLVTTDDNNLRPFYRWCLNKTIQIQDGALAEYTGLAARQYAEKFPKEFFEYIDSDTSLSKYNAWVGAIRYSGFYDNENYKNTFAVRRKMIDRIKQNCKNCSLELQIRIDSFAKDCFP